MSKEIISSTTVLDKTIREFSRSRVVVSYGGSSSGKTIAALYLLTILAMKKPDIEIALIGQSVPILKRNLIKDWKRIVMPNLFERSKWNETDRIYYFDNGSKLVFRNADDPDKFRGYRCDYFLIDEVNQVHEDVFNHLFIRFKGRCILTFNPSKRFWVDKILSQEGVSIVHSTYKDNEFCPKEVGDNLELFKEINDNFYKVFCLGEYGSTEGIVYEKWMLADEMPDVFDYES